MDSIDSYVSFLLHFDIDEDKFLNWGINNIIYPPMTEIEKEWESLKYRINNNQKVFIRGYGRNGHRTELYTKMYEQIFNNYNVTIDPSNNTAPKKMIEKLTNNKNCKKYINFQRAHIFARTKNIYLFEAPWNICYIPKLFDPFSGHEAKGHLPEKFQQMFLNNAYNKYKEYIQEYNLIINENRINEKIESYLESVNEQYSPQILTQFSIDVKNEWSEIVIE